jgi:glucan-binding YG repeat protein
MARRWSLNNQFLKEEFRMETMDKKYFITGNSYAIKDQLKELGFKWDAEAKNWYHNNETIASTAQKFVPEGPEKHFIHGNCYPFTEQLKEMECRWDPDSKAWYHLNKEIAEKAQALVSKAPEIQSNGKAQDGASAEKHYIPEVPFELNKTLKQMGCNWDAETRCWYHSDPEIGKEANRLVLETCEKLQGHEPGPNKSESAGIENSL